MNDSNNIENMSKTTASEPSVTTTVSTEPTTVNAQPTARNSQLREKANKRKKSKKPLVDKLQQEVNNALANCKEGAELKVLCFALQPDPQRLEWIYYKIEKDLYKTLSVRYGKSVINVGGFGSSFNALAFKDSDFDLYIQISQQNKPITKLIYETISSMQYTKLFNQMLPIINAKIPIIKCVHTATGYSCDISFFNGLGIYNTNVIRYLMDFDYRIHPLTIILKYWMRTHKLSGTGKITNYCLTMMIIYYLQTVKPLIIPPYCEFQKNISEFKVDHWNLACDITVKCRSRNKTKVSFLLLGFFQFYADFNFEENIICTLYGRIYNRQQFQQNIPKVFERYINYLKSKDAMEFNLKSPMCIQDPFNLSHNVASCCGINNYQLFKIELKHAADICNAHLSSSAESAELLLRLFNESAPPVTKNLKLIHAFASIITSKNEQHFECKLSPIEIELSMVRTILAKTQKTTVENIDIKKKWAEKVIEFILTIFEKLMCFEIKNLNKPTENGSAAKCVKRVGQNDVYANQLNENIELNASYDVYRNRKLLKPNTPSYLTVEEELSKRNFVSKQNPFHFHCNVSITTNEKFEYVHLSFQDCTTIKKNNAMKIVFNTFTLTIRNHIKAYLLKYQTECLQNAINP